MRTRVQNLVDFLGCADIAADVNNVVAKAGRVTWANTTVNDQPSCFLSDAGEPTVAEYMQWARHREYSAMLFDGSLLQITYDCIGGEVIGHRLAYVPCPFPMDEQLIRTESICDLIELYGAQPASEALARATLRFDYDPGSASHEHPASHLTVNSPSCRIACVAAVSLGHFVSLVFRMFYPRLWLVHGYLREMKKEMSNRTITMEQETDIHFAWVARPYNRAKQ